jgi:hypothetical protein
MLTEIPLVIQILKSVYMIPPLIPPRWDLGNRCRDPAFIVMEKRDEKFPFKHFILPSRDGKFPYKHFIPARWDEIFPLRKCFYA